MVTFDFFSLLKNRNHSYVVIQMAFLEQVTNHKRPNCLFGSHYTTMSKRRQSEKPQCLSLWDLAPPASPNTPQSSSGAHPTPSFSPRTIAEKARNRPRSISNSEYIPPRHSNSFSRATSQDMVARGSHENSPRLPHDTSPRLSQDMSPRFGYDMSPRAGYDISPRTHYDMSPRMMPDSSPSTPSWLNRARSSPICSPRYRSLSLDAVNLEADLIMQKANEELQRKMTVLENIKSALSTPPPTSRGNRQGEEADRSNL